MIKIRELSYGIKKKQILNQIYVSFDHGVYGLLGPNGAGKTTLLRCITGVYPIQKRKVFVNNADVAIDPACVQRIGYLPQKFGLYKNMTVYQMMSLFAETKKIPKERQEAEIEECLEAVRLSDRKGDRIRTLSGGMVRRMGIAQAILGDSNILLLDEPTAGLDPEERIHFKNIISELAKKDRLVILSTHIVEDVASLCKQIVIMKDGAIVKQGTNGEIADLARGKVWMVPEALEGELVEPYFITRRTERGVRVLSAQRQPGEMVEADIEDGYLCEVKGIV